MVERDGVEMPGSFHVRVGAGANIFIMRNNDIVYRVNWLLVHVCNGCVHSTINRSLTFSETSFCHFYIHYV